jgi:tryptophan 2,3-dioxygenase
MSKPLTYLRYLKLDELLSLQQPLSEGPEHDELLFIVIHQVYELWFKQLLHEGRFLRDAFQAGDASRALIALNRFRTILKTLVGQVDILETMTPLSFNAFRSRLEAASGFQSAQFRELEFLLGQKRRSAVEHYPEGGTDRRILEARYRQPTVWDAFLHYLAGNGYAVPQAVLQRDVTERVTAEPEVQRILLRAYRQNPAVAQVCERFVDLDEGFMEWRYRHVKMVQRTIGTKRGTGGTAGAEYLMTTLDKPAFPDLWEIRAEL